MVAAGTRRKGGVLTSEAVAAADGEELDQPLSEDVLPAERTRETDGLTFSRMRMEWRPDELIQIKRIQSLVDGMVLDLFDGAYRLIYDLYDVVREPELDEHGTIATDHLGLTIYKRDHTGSYIEHWELLTSAARERFLYRITASLFTWEQTAADLQGMALYAKAIWTERFAKAFDSLMAGTVDDRRNAAQARSTEEYYFAILRTHLSKRADAVVRTLNTLVRVLSSRS